MITHDLIQGSPEWLAYRAQHFNASDAPAMMGCSPYKTRAQLLRELHTGIVPEPDVATEKRFANGHRAEALARPLAEEIIGEELYPITGSEGRYSASFDGLTLDESQGFEHKALNGDIRAAFAAMAEQRVDREADGWLLPLYHRVQMEQQLLVSGAECILFMASEWTADGELVEERHCWYYPDDELRGQILAGWAQFEKDLAAYVPQERPEPVTAAPMESLPAVAVRMDGALQVHSNLPAFGAALRAFVERIPRQPTTDQEFADTEAACKALKRAEDALDAAEANALAGLADVETMRRLVADFRALARDTRLERSKMVERRKLEIREQAVAKSRQALDLHIEVVNAEIAPMRLQPVPADFAGAIKGLKSLDSMHAKLDATLAAAKIAADTQGRAIRKNLEHFKEAAAGLEALFADLHQLVHKSPEDFRAAVQARVLAQQERDRKAEEARKAAEAQRIAEAEKRAREDEARKIALAAAPAVAPHAALVQKADKPEPAATLSSLRGMATMPPGKTSEGIVQSSRADEPATLKLGDIGERLGFALRADFITGTLHVAPSAVERGLPRFTESQFGLICRQLVAHVSAMAEVHAVEEVA